MADQDEEDMRDAARHKRIERALAILSEDFEAVQIIAVPTAAEDASEDQIFVDGFGSSLARAGAAHMWLNGQSMERSE